MRLSTHHLVLAFAFFAGLVAASHSLSHHPRHKNFAHDLNRRQPIDAIFKKLEGAVGKIKLVSEGTPLLAPLQNATVAAACRELERKRSKNSMLSYFGSVEYIGSIDHYMGSSAQAPVCVFRPRTADDLQAAMSIIHQRQIEFAVASGKHTGNPGFSSTRGLHIDLRNFNQIELSEDKSTINIGPGNVWDDVYQALEGTNRAVGGGRSSGVGVGGFLTGGGGFSYYSSQYGLTSDALLSMDVILPDGRRVLASKESNADLFFAIKGGGNQFGIVYNFCLRTYPQTDKIWGGTRLYIGDGLEQAKTAIHEFQTNNKDPKAQLIPSFNNVAGVGILGLLASYDGVEPPQDVFAAFDNISYVSGQWEAATPRELARTSMDNLTFGIRGTFHTVSAHYFTPEVIDFADKEGQRLNNLVRKIEDTIVPRSGIFFSLVPDSISINYGARTSAANNAWSYEKSPQPMSFYYGWLDPLDDDFYFEEIKKSANKVRQMLTDAGQKIDDLPLYPNYARADTPAEQIYEPQNLERLRQIKRKYDPTSTMRLAGFYKF